jgi:CDP-6-deoxy-D-xylo-4-hexulose-3-dehydrase
VQFLEGRRIATRLIFAGNLVRQPAYKGLTFRTVGELPNSDRVMRNAFWVGVWPGLTEPMLEWVVESIRTFCRGAVR